MTFDPAPLAPSTYTGEVPRHPARWSLPVFQVIEGIVAGVVDARSPDLFSGDRYRVLDPCAGVGGIHALEQIAGVETWGVEVQPEWAAAHPRTVVGDSSSLPDTWTGQFDAVVTSLVFPNRMTDSHVARDPCARCGGSGCYVSTSPDRRKGDPPFCAGEKDGHRTPVPTLADDHHVCPTCRGHGLSRRNTYRHALDEVGAPVADGSAAVHGWGPRYQRLNLAIIASAARTLRPYGRLLLNMSNHLADGTEVPVVEWYISNLLAATVPAPGEPMHTWVLDRIIPVPARRNRQGANGDARVAQEFVLALHRRY